MTMLRLFTAAILTLVVLTLPALCAAGVLIHACDCGEIGGCSHEEDCSSDPCLDPAQVPHSDGIPDADSTTFLWVIPFPSDHGSMNLENPIPPDPLAFYPQDFSFRSGDQPLLL